VILELSKIRPEVMETMKNLLSAWIQNQSKRKSCAVLPTIKERLKVFVILSRMIVLLRK
jgi:hypothetical protein